MLHQTLWVGAYATASQAGVTQIIIDPERNEAQINGVISGVDNPSYLALSMDGRTLYAALETMSHSGGEGGQIAAWRLEEGRPPRLMALRPSGGRGPCHVSVGCGGRALFAANYMSGSAVAYSLDGDGCPAERLDACLTDEGYGPHPVRQEMAHMHCACWREPEGLLYAADLGLDQVQICRYAPGGALQAVSSLRLPAGAGPRHLAFSRDGSVMYVVCELNAHVYVYRHAGFASNRLIQEISALPAGFSGENTAAAIVRGDHCLYVSNRGHDSVAVFPLEADGLLAPPAHVPCGGKCPRDIALSADGRYMAVANQQSDCVAFFSVAPGGMLAPAMPSVAVHAPTCVLFQR